MTLKRITPYVTASLTVPARDELQRAARKLGVAADRRVTLSDALTAMLAVMDDAAVIAWLKEHRK